MASLSKQKIAVVIKVPCQELRPSSVAPPFTGYLPLNDLTGSTFNMIDKKSEYAVGTAAALHELATLTAARHDRIVQVHEFIEVGNGLLYIVMEPAMTDLLQKIKELNHISSYQAKIWFSQILSAMAFLHQKDIVHRDLKCENVLLTADHQVLYYSKKAPPLLLGSRCVHHKWRRPLYNMTIINCGAATTRNRDELDDQVWCPSPVSMCQGPNSFC
ncbi:hypothetical protein NFI96_002722 [Prochilodus magdalenae]|nr:hypothetical protein NFI96_002722 [Prochilodus magdalenae]